MEAARDVAVWSGLSRELVAGGSGLLPCPRVTRDAGIAEVCYHYVVICTAVVVRHRDLRQLQASGRLKAPACALLLSHLAD